MALRLRSQMYIVLYTAARRRNDTAEQVMAQPRSQDGCLEEAVSEGCSHAMAAAPTGLHHHRIEKLPMGGGKGASSREAWVRTSESIQIKRSDARHYIQQCICYSLHNICDFSIVWNQIP